MPDAGRSSCDAKCFLRNDMTPCRCSCGGHARNESFPRRIDTDRRDVGAEGRAHVRLSRLATAHPDVASHTYLSRIREDSMGGVRGGVNGTPTFFIKGVRFDGDWTELDGFVEASSGWSVSV